MQFCASCGDQTPEAPCASCGADPRLGGRYILRSLLGQGSHGMTWRAEDAQGAVVAIKVINLGRGLDTTGTRALDREVAVLRQLSHPQIPDLLDDFSTRSGMTRYRCIVQEFIDGPHLLQELSTTRHTAAEVLETIAAVADILSHLHTLTPPIIHRDIKPQNIIRRTDGTLVLIDFGSVRDTLVGTLGGTMSVGTIGYMAPEQITGDVRPASDLYALGALTAHLLTRQPPKLTHDPAAPVRWRKPPGLSDGIGALVNALLSPDPAARPGSAREVARQARQLARQPALPAPPPERPEPPAPAPSAPSVPSRSMIPLLVLYPLLGVAAVVSTVAALVEVETVMASGPAGALLGLAVAFLALRRRQVLGVLAGLSAPAFSLLCFLVIVIGNISTSGVEQTLPLAMGVYALVLLVALAAAGGLAVGGERRRIAPRKGARFPGRRRRGDRSVNRIGPPMTLKRAWGSRKEREAIKEMAREWRAGVVPEAHHRCPFCGTRVSPNGLVRHYDKVHRPQGRSRRRQRYHQ